MDAQCDLWSQPSCSVDEVLLTEHEYGARVCKKTGATLQTTPESRCKSEDRAAQILSVVIKRTRVLPISYITVDIALLPGATLPQLWMGRTHPDTSNRPNPSSIQCDYYAISDSSW
jgi:hypothetical protein